MKKLKPFDLEAAKRGEPICFGDGTPAHFVGMTVLGNVAYQTANSPTSVFSLPQEVLRMAPKKRTVYMNLYDDGRAYYYQSEADALAGSTTVAIAVAVPVEIEV